MHACQSCRSVVVASVLLLAGGLMSGEAQAGDEPWADDPHVREVLELRRQALEALTTTGPSAETERYSSTFIANTPSSGVLPAERLLALFAEGTISYDEVSQTVEYAGSHGPDVVVIMGEEVVVPGEGMADAGRRVVRRFTDVFRREDGEWRHDLRHANVVRVE